MTVTVTWVDGAQEAYSCYDASARDGVLYLSQRMHSGEPMRAIPLASVRIWTRTGD